MPSKQNRFPANMPLMSVDIDSCLELPCHVYLKNPDGIYLKCNFHQAISFGLTDPSHVIGCTDRDFFNNKDFAIIRSNDNEVLNTEQPLLITETVSVNHNPAISK